jgi:cell division protein FtsB
MNTKEKRVGTKAEIRAIKNRERRIATTIFLVFILLIVIFSSYFTYNFLNQPQNQTTTPASSQLKAAIVDQLSLTFPNQTFIETATNTLKQAGYAVDYYPGEKVTVEFYRNLPTHGYSIIILRTHSSASGLGGTQRVEIPVVLFTSELYSNTKYVYEQLANQVVQVSYNVPEPPYYFAIDPSFVTSSTTGKFQNTLVIMMGCEGLDNTFMAEAFVEKGAKVYVGWNQPVSASHTDTATTQLLQHFLVEKLTLKQSVQETFKEVGFDPIYKSLLIYYPLEAGEQTIENTP